MKSMRIFTSLLLVLVIFFAYLIAAESYDFAQKVCYGWSSEVSISCSIGFLDSGLILSLSRNIVFSSLFQGEMVTSKPHFVKGCLILLGFLFFILLCIIALVRLWRRKRSEIPRKASTAPKSIVTRKFLNAEFILSCSILLIVGFSAIRYLRIQNSKATDRSVHAISVQAVSESSHSDKNSLLGISKDIELESEKIASENCSDSVELKKSCQQLAKAQLNSLRKISKDEAGQYESARRDAMTCLMDVVDKIKKPGLNSSVILKKISAAVLNTPERAKQELTFRELIAGTVVNIEIKPPMSTCK